MNYVIADIHGCYPEFLTLLEQLRFSEADTLYLLGDLVDRGPEPIPLLRDILCRPNVCPILGNHEYMMLTVLRRLSVEITPENAETHLTASDLTGYLHWTQDGGQVTGHTPTQSIRQDKQPLIYREQGHIALDCGCVYGGRLAAFCLESGAEFYVERQL